MILLSSIINEFKDRFLDRYKNSVLPSHKKALQAMAQCRQEYGPHMLAQCTDHNCGKQIYIPHSCGHRNCPHCQCNGGRCCVIPFLATNRTNDTNGPQDGQGGAG